MICVLALSFSLTACDEWVSVSDETNQRFAQTCLAYKELNRGFIDWKNATPENLRQRMMAELKSKTDISGLKNQFQLMAEDSIEGRKSRWEEAMKGAIEKHCEYALSKREPEQILNDLKSIAQRYLQAEPK